MFIMPARKRQNGKTYTYYCLVNTVRTPKGPRHRVVLTLGKLPDFTGEERKLLGRLITQKLGGTIRLLPPASAALEAEAERISALVGERREREASTREQTLHLNPGRIQLGEALLLGPVYVGVELWGRLKLNEILGECGFSRRRRRLASMQVVSRLVAPASELATDAWVRRTGLGILTGEQLSSVNKDALYRTSDALWAKREAIEAALAGRERSLFDLQECFILYDLTSTYFEGLAVSNAKAKRGYSRDHRGDCKQVVVGMVLDEAGFPKASEIYEGNTTDKSTIESMVTGLQRRMGKRGEAATVIMDRGIATEANLTYLKEAGYHYLVGCPGEERDAWIGVLSSGEFHHVAAASKSHPGVEVCVKSRGEEQYLFVRSPLRVEKDRGIRERFVGRMQTGLEKLSEQIEGGKIKDRVKIERRIGKIEEKNKRARRYFTVTLTEVDGAKKLIWRQEEEKLKEAALLDGCYTLKTDRSDIAEESLWSLYTMLNRVERSFRYLKSSLGIRPNFHQLEHRVEGHIFISILAYHLLHAAEQLLLADGDHRSWPTINGELDTHRVITMRMTDAEGKVHHRRAVTHPTAAQREIYRRLGLSDRPLRGRQSVAEQAV